MAKRPMTARTLERYLSRYAEDDVHLLDAYTSSRTYAHCIVVPCLREAPAFVERLLVGPLAQANALVIVVVNQGAPAPEPLNLVLLDFFAGFTGLWQNGHLRLCQAPGSQLHWLVVNRTQPELILPVDQGVGLARKIGCDLAVGLAARKVITSSWIHSTDADAHLPADYLAPPNTTYCGAVYAFKHIRAAANEREWLATQLYEQALRYYVAGLSWAGSPYAQQPIGSLLAFSITAYCQVRGFPKRSAGEDFYLLNKLTKLGPIYNPPTIVEIEARTSDRVPFGTGPNVKRIAALNDPATEYCYYAPDIYLHLKTWLDTIPNVWSALQAKRDPLADLPAVVRVALVDAGIDAFWSHLQQQVKDAAACERALHTWFDAFQTLKFIRRLQAEAYPPRPLYECLRDAPFR